MKLPVVVGAAVVLASCGCADHHRRVGPGDNIDAGIAHEIDSIWAVDNHAHPVLSPPADATDREFDALPVDSLEPNPSRLRFVLISPPCAMPGKRSMDSTLSRPSMPTA